jgi:hypothetical protein
MLELGALLVIFMVCMILALAVRENETQLRTTMQVDILSLRDFVGNTSHYLDCFFLYLSGFYYLDDLVYVRYY